MTVKVLVIPATEGNDIEERELPGNGEYPEVILLLASFLPTNTKLLRMTVERIVSDELHRFLMQLAYPYPLEGVRLSMWVDEDGHMKHLPPNPRASRFAPSRFPIVGPALLIAEVDHEDGTVFVNMWSKVNAEAIQSYVGI